MLVPVRKASRAIEVVMEVVMAQEIPPVLLAAMPIAIVVIRTTRKQQVVISILTTAMVPELVLVQEITSNSTSRNKDSHGSGSRNNDICRMYWVKLLIVMKTCCKSTRNGLTNRHPQTMNPATRDPKLISQVQP